MSPQLKLNHHRSNGLPLYMVVLPRLPRTPFHLMFMLEYPGLPLLATGEVISTASVLLIPIDMWNTFFGS